MPEIMSAEEFRLWIDKIKNDVFAEKTACLPRWADGFMLPEVIGREIEQEIEKRIDDEIKSRDSAMLEKYKDAIKKAEARSKKMQLCANNAIAALDSAFAEIEGGM